MEALKRKDSFVDGKMMKKILIRAGVLMAIALPLSGCSDGWCWPFDCTASKSSSGVVDDSANTTTTADASTTTTTSTDNSGSTQVTSNAPITPGAQQEFELSKVNWLHTNVSGWLVTHNLTVNLGGGIICMEWGGTSTWPSATIRHRDGTRDIQVNANPWVFVWRNGRWYGGTWEWMQPNTNCKPMSSVEGGHIKQPGLSDWNPVSGETYYFMVSTIARGANLNNYQARTNIVPVVWP
jgi:hypothetical protein